MKHKTLTKLLAWFLAVLILVCPSVVVSAANDASTSSGTGSNSLTDILGAIKYTEYLKKNRNFLQTGGESLKPTEVVLTGDDLFAYAEDITTAYHCDCTSAS